MAAGHTSSRLPLATDVPPRSASMVQQRSRRLPSSSYRRQAAGTHCSSTLAHLKHLKKLERDAQQAETPFPFLQPECSPEAGSPLVPGHEHRTLPGSSSLKHLQSDVPCSLCHILQLELPVTRKP